MDGLEYSMQRLALRSPKFTPYRGGKETLKPPVLYFPDEPPAQAAALSMPRNRVHGEVGHDREDSRDKTRKGKGSPQSR
jgi:hypothetical protein